MARYTAKRNKRKITKLFAQLPPRADYMKTRIVRYHNMFGMTVLQVPDYDKLRAIYLSEEPTWSED